MNDVLKLSGASMTEQIVGGLTMKWKNRCTAHWMNHEPRIQRINESEDQWITKSTNQKSQWITESMNRINDQQWINESVNHWINESMIWRFSDSMKSLAQWFNESMHQPINQGIVEPMIQRIKEAVHQQSHESINETMIQRFSESMNQWVSESASPWRNESRFNEVTESMNHWVNHPWIDFEWLAIQRVNESLSQRINESTNQYIIQSMNHATDESMNFTDVITQKRSGPFFFDLKRKSSSRYSLVHFLLPTSFSKSAPRSACLFPFWSAKRALATVSTTLPDRGAKPRKQRPYTYTSVTPEPLY